MQVLTKVNHHVDASFWLTRGHGDAVLHLLDALLGLTRDVCAPTACFKSVSQVWMTEVMPPPNTMRCNPVSNIGQRPWASSAPINHLR